MITERDLEVYRYIKDYVLQNQFYPSVREICKGMGMKSTNTVHHHLEKLQDYGLLIRKSDGSHAYRLAGMKYIMDEV